MTLRFALCGLAIVLVAGEVGQAQVKPKPPGPTGQVPGNREWNRSPVERNRRLNRCYERIGEKQDRNCSDLEGKRLLSKVGRQEETNVGWANETLGLHRQLESD